MDLVVVRWMLELCIMLMLVGCYVLCVSVSVLVVELHLEIVTLRHVRLCWLLQPH